MTATEISLVVERYRIAGNRLAAWQSESDRMASRFGLAYLDQCLATNIATELVLEDRFHAARAELATALNSLDVIEYGGGFYKIDSLGQPRFYEGTF